MHYAGHQPFTLESELVYLVLLGSSWLRLSSLQLSRVGTGWTIWAAARSSHEYHWKHLDGDILLVALFSETELVQLKEGLTNHSGKDQGPSLKRNLLK